MIVNITEIKYRIYSFSVARYQTRYQTWLGTTGLKGPFQLRSF